MVCNLSRITRDAPRAEAADKKDPYATMDNQVSFMQKSAGWAMLLAVFSLSFSRQHPFLLGFGGSWSDDDWLPQLTRSTKVSEFHGRLD
jgi:hypothetical protein